jgi:PAS domain S-box-containing protein
MELYLQHTDERIMNPDSKNTEKERSGNESGEESLKESEQLYHSLFDGSDDGMLFLSEGVVIDCNQAVLDILNCKREFVINHSPSNFSPVIQPDGKNSIESSKEKIELTSIGIPQRFYWQHMRKDGSLVDCDISLRAITVAGKKIIQGTMRDITEIKRSEKFRQVLFDISEMAYIAPDMSSLYKNIHEKIAELMPVKNIYIALYDEKTDMISFPYFVDEFDPPQLPKKLGAGLTEYILRKGEGELINAQKDLELRKAGEVELIGEPAAIWLGVPLKLSGKTIGVIVVQDYENEPAYGEEEMQILTFVSEQIAHVIERKRASEAIKKYAEELRQLNNTKDKFFSIIAHDLRNPFITILGFSDLLVSDFNDLTDDEKIYYISEMKKSAEISHNLLQNLLQWSRSQTGRIEFNPSKLDISQIISCNVELLTPHAAGKQIQITSIVPDNIFVRADEDMLNTILRNLITNAIKFTNTGGSIIIGFADGTDQLTVCVSDNGVGMSESVKDKLFKADENQTTMGTAQEAGTGLGLILCKEFVEKHGCKIWVESEAGKGSKFCFTLPKFV